LKVIDGQHVEIVFRSALAEDVTSADRHLAAQRPPPSKS
jgi:hypothetical protein